MARCRESRLEFDFDAALEVHTHDVNGDCNGKYRRDDNSMLPGVDFRIKDAAGWLWLEVKNWRISSRKAYPQKMRSVSFAREMREKFLGTIVFLASRGDPDALPRPLTLIFLFQPPPGADAGLRVVCQGLIRDQIHSILTPLDIRFAVVDTETWNKRFPDYPVKHV